MIGPAVGLLYGDVHPALAPELEVSMFQTVPTAFEAQRLLQHGMASLLVGLEHMYVPWIISATNSQLKRHGLRVLL